LSIANTIITAAQRLLTKRGSRSWPELSPTAWHRIGATVGSVYLSEINSENAVIAEETVYAEW